MQGQVSEIEGLDRKSPTPLWAQLHEILLRQLESGEFEREFPGEHAIAAQYGVSRNTVREALRRLRSEGMVIAERGRKPRVGGAPPITQNLGSLYSLFSSVESNGLDQRSEVRAMDIRVDAIAAAQLGLEPRSELFHLERIRIVEEEPLAVDRIWVPANIGRELLDADFTRSGFYDVLARLAGVTLDSGNEIIRAVVPSNVDRVLLAVDSDAAALSIERVSRSGDVAVEWRKTIVRGDRFSVAAEFTSKAAYSKSG